MKTRMRFLTCLLLSAAFTLLAPSHATAQATKKKGDLELRVYQLSDLVLPIPDFLRESQSKPKPVIPNRGGGGLGGGGYGGGGQFNVAQFGGNGQPGAIVQPSGKTKAPSSRFTLIKLKEIIGSMVEPASWDVRGGTASMRHLGTMLLIMQTPEAHAKITKLLDAIRREGGTLQSVTIEARWLLLDSDQLSELRSKSPSSQHVNREELERFTRSETSYRGQITCFSGQTTTIQGGEQRSAIVSAIPVVGSSVGYQPVIRTVNVGATLTVQPMLLQGKNAVILNLKSSVNDMDSSLVTTPLRAPTPAGTSTRGSSTTKTEASIITINLEKVNVIAQEFATSLRVPLNQPVLVGGMTLTSAIGKEAQAKEIGQRPRAGSSQPRPTGIVKKLVRQGERRQLYLIVEVTVDSGEERPSGKAK